MPKTPTQRLAEIDAIIEQLEAALDDEATQEYSIGGRTWKRIDLPKAILAYEELREKYQQRALTSSGGRRVLGGLRRS